MNILEQFYLDRLEKNEIDEKIIKYCKLAKLKVEKLEKEFAINYSSKQSEK